MQENKNFSLSVQCLDGGDHAANAELDLAERIDGDAETGGNLDRRLALKRVGAVSRHRAVVQHGPRKPFCQPA